jgi:hypothetical protein
VVFYGAVVAAKQQKAGQKLAFVASRALVVFTFICSRNQHSSWKIVVSCLVCQQVCRSPGRNQTWRQTWRQPAAATKIHSLAFGRTCNCREVAPPFLDIFAINVQMDERRGSSLQHGHRAKVGSNLLSLRPEERECASVLVA